MKETTIKKAWDNAGRLDEHLLLGFQNLSLELPTLHPDTAQIFRLWQVYLDNVNPLLKVTHVPTIQARLVAAVGNLFTIDPVFEALMFSIYCTAVLSLDDEECRSILGSPREELSVRYQSGCQQALLKCGFMRTDDRDCLTAFFLYLVSETRGLKKGILPADTFRSPSDVAQSPSP